jgi:hypothetical protein
MTWRNCFVLAENLLIVSIVNTIITQTVLMCNPVNIYIQFLGLWPRAVIDFHQIRLYKPVITYSYKYKHYKVIGTTVNTKVTPKWVSPSS